MKQAHNGVMDLTDYDLQSGDLVELKGEWNIYWNQFLLSGDSAINPKITIEVPRRWNSIPWAKGSLPDYGKATYQLTLKFDEQSINQSGKINVLGLKIRDIHSAYRVFMNGKHIFDKGNVNEKPNYRARLGHETIFFEADSSVMVLDIHVANYSDPRQAGMDETIILGPAQHIEKSLFNNNFIYILSFGILFVLFFYHMLLYLFRPKDKVNLYFSLACLVLSVQSIFMGEKLIYYLLPNLDANLYISISMASLMAVAFLFMYYNKLLPNEFPHTLAIIITCFYCIESVLFLTRPFRLNLIANITYLITLLITAYGFIGLIVAIIRKRPNAVLIFIGTSFVILAGINDTLHALEIIYTGYFAPVGFIIYTFSQSALISFKFSQSFNQAEKLSNELESLNQKLEGLVVDRTLDLEEANKNLLRLNATKDRFFSIIAHDLKGPVSAVNSALEMAISPDFTEETRTELLTVIYNSTENTYKLLENLLEWSRSQQGEIKYKPETIYLSDIVKHVETLLNESAKNKGIRINNNIEADLKVFCDVNMVQTVLRNLVSNAIKYTHKGGVVTIKTSSVDEERAIVSISDTGIGMSEKLMERLFRIDEKVRSEQGTDGESGTGLGLIISNEFLAKHGSELKVDSQLNSGSTFSFSLMKIN